MATGFDKLMSTPPRPAIGKVRVGDPPPPPAGKEGVIVRVAVFFDGTKNNRSNTTKRLTTKGTILKVDGHDGGSSYGNYYSNPAIHEFMNNRNNPEKHEVSHYVEGIGTRNYVEGATHKVKKKVKVLVPSRVAGVELYEWQEVEVDELIKDKDNGQDDLYGNGFGAGPTGIPKKVDSGIEQLRIKIKKAYTPKQYIQKIVVDVFGFSRGAAAGRHFIHRREELLRGPGNKSWPGQRPPELEINFVGLYDSVSSFAKGYDSLGSTLVNARTSLNTDYIFCDDVGELGLNMGGTPKRVVHLTAADEHRQNFSLTNITTSLTAGVGLELTLPGVHSDIGGSYVEAGAGGGLNTEARCIRSEKEKRRLIAEGWYTDGSPGPDGQPTPNQFVRREEYHRFSRNEWVWYGVRSLTTDYQFVVLRIMHDFARARGGKHKEMDLADFTGRFAAYAVPPPLRHIGDYLLTQAKALDGARTRQVIGLSAANTKWLRNHYLHRSAKQDGDAEAIGMEARADTIKGHLHTERLVIPDTMPSFIAPSLEAEQGVTTDYTGI